METSELRGWLNERNSEIFSRAAFAKRTILKESKKRRDLRRYYYAKQASLVYGIKTGKYLSWGYGTMQSEYDEYFGEINASNQPHGLGVKFYTDGSVYHGHWSNGNQHTAEGGVWIRSNGLIYEGGWVAGKKHGYGKLSYPETEGQKVSYEGQFANGLEHGQGILTYTDKSIHKGRFRFGKRDGPGVYMDAFGQSVRGNFKDKPTAAYIDHSPPKVYEDEIPAKSLNNPGSLLELSIRALAYHGTYIPRVPAMHPRRLQQKIDKFESDSALSHNFDSMKQLLAMDFYKALNDVAPVHMKQKKDTEFQSALSRGSFVFSREKQVVFNSSRVSEADMEALLFFQGGNDTLEELSLVGCGLRSGAVEALGRQIKLWPKLRSLDLSFNKLGAVNVILTGYTRCLQTLRLRGCGLNNFDMAILTKLVVSCWWWKTVFDVCDA